MVGAGFLLGLIFLIPASIKNVNQRSSSRRTAAQAAQPRARRAAGKQVCETTLDSAPALRPAIAKKHEAKRRAILDVAGRLFVERGYPATTMDELCRELGVTKPSVYHYFPDKYSILAALCMDSATQTQRVFREPSEPGLSPAARLEAGLRKLARRTLENLPAATLTYRDSQYLRPETAAEMRRIADEYYDDLYALLEEGRRAGELEFADVKVTAHAISGVVGFTYTWYRSSGPLDVETLAGQLTELMMRMVRPASPRRPRSRKGG